MPTSASPATDFFERQARARRSTSRLVFCFILAIAGTALLVYSPFGFFIASQKGAGTTFFEMLKNGWDAKIFFCVLAGVSLVLSVSSLVKYASIARISGGEIAKSLGGREVSPAAKTASERRLLNIVQEMSLASGVPAPSVFILEEERSINAFAAGTRINNAAVAVSRGALDKLSRDELQAVIGHEFSHILNGDMQLNIRLVGWIYGLTMLHTIGCIVLYCMRGFSGGNSKSKETGGVVAVIGLVGVAAFVAGAIGSFFASIIQAGISRSREQLADASSAQFTRNPIALANALARIGGDQYGSKISSPRAGEFAHLFFASGVSSLFSTHPPLEKRILALNPAWDGRWLPPANPETEHFNERKKFPAAAQSAPRRDVPAPADFSAGIPPFVRQLAQDADDAKALIYLMLMTDSPESNVEQAKILKTEESPGLFSRMKNLWAEMSAVPWEKRISAVLLAAPALRELRDGERRRFFRTLNAIAEADGKISLFEFCILNAARGILFPDGNARLSGKQLIREAELVLNLFLAENPKPEKNRQILAAALSRQTAFPREMNVLPAGALTLPALENAFSRLRCADPDAKKELMNAAAEIAASDGNTSANEADLLRAFAAALDCPPPRI